MNRFKIKHWAAIALAALSGPALAASPSCTLVPKNSIIVEGDSLTMGVLCDFILTSIEWKMAGGLPVAGPGAGTNFVSVTGNVSVSNYTVNDTIPFTAPVGKAGDYQFQVTATDSANTLVPSNIVNVTVKPSTVVAATLGVLDPMKRIDAACGTSQGKAVQSMPTGTAQCNPGKPALAISGPQSFTWSCLSLTGGAEANCYALRGFTVTATAGANGSVSPATQGVASGEVATVTATPVSGYSAMMSGCGGTQSGNSLTTAPITADCTVSAAFSNAPINGACGSAAGVTATVTPSANLCGSGSATSVATATASYSWSCAGANGGSTASCQAPHAFAVSATAGANGSISPASKEVVGNTSTTFTVTPASDYVASVSGCGGTLSGSTYTTAPITAACAVSASFSVLTASTTDPGYGKGLWVPPNMPNRTVADQTGTEGLKTSYVPGCLNGLTAVNSSSGCAALNSYTGTIAGTTTSRTVTLGSGNQLVLRYKSTSTAGAAIRSIQALGADGSNVSVNMRVWLSANPSATYDSVEAMCKQTTNVRPTVVTGPGYCPISPNTIYYFGIEYDEALSLRLQINESGADFL